MKRFFLFGIVAVLLLISAPTVSASVIGDGFGKVFESLNSFFTQDKYNAYSKAVDLIIFFLLYFGSFWLGARYGFREMTREIRMLVLVLAITAAILSVLAGFSIGFLVPYMHYFLLLLAFGLLYALLGFFGVESKLLRAVLALLILAILTVLLLSLVPEFGAGSLLSTLEVPALAEIEGPTDRGAGSDYFDSLGRQNTNDPLRQDGAREGILPWTERQVHSSGIRDWFRGSCGQHQEEVGTDCVSRCHPSAKFTPRSGEPPYTCECPPNTRQEGEECQALPAGGGTTEERNEEAQGSHCDIWLVFWC